MTKEEFVRSKRWRTSANSLYDYVIKYEGYTAEIIRASGQPVIKWIGGMNSRTVYPTVYLAVVHRGDDKRSSLIEFKWQDDAKREAFNIIKEWSEEKARTV